jgi:hypothetical protein
LFKRFLALVLIAPALVVGVIATSSPASAAKTKCETSGRNTTCYELLSTKESTFRNLFTDGVKNPTDQPAKLVCTVSAESAYSATASIAISAGVKAWIIGKMDASVSASITASVKVTVGTQVEKVVPPQTVLYCDRGSYTYVGTTRKTGSSGQHPIKPTTFTVKAPSAVIWQFRQKNL